MSIDSHYHRDERFLVRIAVLAGVMAAFVSSLLEPTLSPASEKVSAETVWSYIQEQAPKLGFDPEFVYAIAWAESSLNPEARSSAARGIMQITRPAWKEVSQESYRQAWDWRTNIRVGILYLNHCRKFLLKHGEYSYPLLAASYRYGHYYVRDENFTIKQMRVPRNEIYKRIFSGNIHPVEPPARVARLK